MAPTAAVRTGKEDVVEVPADPSGKPLTYIFKTVSEGHLGEMAFFKVVSGTIKPGAELINQQSAATERLAQLYTFQGKNRTDLSSAAAGDIGVAVKLKKTHTSNTLAAKGYEVSVKPTVFPNPVMDVAIRPKAKGDEEKVAAGLSKLHEEDLSLIHI